MYSKTLSAVSHNKAGYSCNFGVKYHTFKLVLRDGISQELYDLYFN